MNQTLHICTLNIHKGLTSFNARFALHEQRKLLRKHHADIVFLQEVRDVHIKHSERYEDWPAQGQASFMAENIWPDFVYGKNSVYADGHHGNLVLSKFPIQHSDNRDISAHASEQRGMLHCEIGIPEWDQPLHTICVHLGLFAHWRRQQLGEIRQFIEQHVPPDAPLIIAGDFNDWSQRAGRIFAESLHLHEVFEHSAGKPARSFPAWLPILRMDRIYVRGFQVRHAQAYSGYQFAQVSDHAMLTATLSRL